MPILFYEFFTYLITPTYLNAAIASQHLTPMQMPQICLYIPTALKGHRYK